MLLISTTIKNGCHASSFSRGTRRALSWKTNQSRPFRPPFRKPEIGTEAASCKAGCLEIPNSGAKPRGAPRSQSITAKRRPPSERWAGADGAPPPTRLSRSNAIFPVRIEERNEVMSIQAILYQKGANVETIAPDGSVKEAGAR